MAMGEDQGVAGALLRALERLLSPVARILLRYGVTHVAFAEVAKRVFVDVATKEFSLPGRKLSDSRIAVLTGLARRDIARLRRAPEDAQVGAEEHLNRAARVIAGWRRDPALKDSGGRPLVLHFEGEEPSFASVVSRYAGDVPARATLDELVRVGAVERLSDGRLRLVARAYVPRAADTATIAVLGSHVADLVRSIEYNLEHEPEEAFFQRRVVYDNIPEDRATGLRPTVAARGQETLEKLDQLLAENDRDASPDVDGVGRRRVVLGMYYLEEDVADDQD